MATLVRTCPKCRKLMWVKDEQMTSLNDSTIRMTCPHCRQLVRLSLVTQGENAAGPKMGH
ncbi:MAG: hypothetical protein FJ246_05935 [Nitrospira sp.]|nr:hypothetical protein [Nitrospira sp.]